MVYHISEQVFEPELNQQPMVTTMHPVGEHSQSYYQQFSVVILNKTKLSMSKGFIIT